MRASLIKIVCLFCNMALLIAIFPANVAKNSAVLVNMMFHLIWILHYHILLSLNIPL